MKRKFISLETMLKQRREAVGMTQGSLSRELGYSSPQFISNWERGQSAIPERHFRKISQLLGVPMREMVDHRCRDYRREINVNVRLY